MKIQKNIPLAPLTTFRIGGPARFYVVARTIADIKEAMTFAKANKLPVFFLGGGSNILIPDNGLKGLVIKLGLDRVAWDKDTVAVGAGYSWDKLVGQAVKRGLSGLENLSLIPGTVGGAIYQNIGAYGAQICDAVKAVQVLEVSSGKIRNLSVRQCQFGYRQSVFKTSSKKYIILSATLKLAKKFQPNLSYPDLHKTFANKKPSLSQIRQAVIKIRRNKLVYPSGQTGSAGSFFKNPVIPVAVAKKIMAKFPDLKAHLTQGGIKFSAGQLIERAGLKGYRLGQVGVSDQHALVLVNHGGGTAKEMALLAQYIQDRVYKMFSIQLIPEVEIL